MGWGWGTLKARCLAGLFSSMLVGIPQRNILPHQSVTVVFGGIPGSQRLTSTVFWLCLSVCLSIFLSLSFSLHPFFHPSLFLPISSFLLSPRPPPLSLFLCTCVHMAYILDTNWDLVSFFMALHCILWDRDCSESSVCFIYTYWLVSKPAGWSHVLCSPRFYRHLPPHAEFAWLLELQTQVLSNTTHMTITLAPQFCCLLVLGAYLFMVPPPQTLPPAPASV